MSYDSRRRPRAARRSAAALSLVVGAAAAGGGALAQTLPQASQQIEEIERRTQQPPGALPATPAEPTPAPAPPGAEDVLFTLGGVALVDETGAPLGPETGFPLDAMRAVFAEDLGRRISAADMLRHVQNVRVALRKDGYVFTNVTLPDPRRQLTETDPAQVTLVVTGVVVETLEIQQPDGDIGPAIETARRIAAPLMGMRNPRLQDLERVSLLLSDIPGIERATFVPSAGSSPGAIRLDLNLARDPLGFIAIADNRQAPIVGPGLIGGVASWNSHTPWAGTTEAAWYNSIGDDHPILDLDERGTVQLRHSFYLGAGATRIEARGLYSRSSPGDELAPLDLRNTQTTLTLDVEHPFLRSRALSVWGGIGFDHDRSDSESGPAGKFADDTLAMPYLHLRGVQRDGSGFTRARAELRFGLGILGASERGDAKLSRVDGGGDFSLIRAEIERFQDLGDGFGLVARAKAQWSSEPLLATQEFVYGGALYGKGYDPSELTGDSGFAVYGELNWGGVSEIETGDVGWQFYAFADYGRIFELNDAPPGNEKAGSAGVGVRFNFATRTDVEFELARPLDRDLARNGEKSVRFFAALTQRF